MKLVCITEEILTPLINFLFPSVGKITADDIRRVAKRMLQSKPAAAALGTLKNMPSYADISTALSTNGKLPSARKYNLFR
jgi:processing peptidase subunit alpha